MHIFKFPIAILIIAFTIFSCSSDNGTSNAKPTVLGISPATFSLGEIGSGTITGNNFGGLTSVNLGQGIQVTRFAAPNASQIDFDFVVSEDAPPGARSITVQTTNGSATAASLLTVSDNHAPVARFNLFPDFGATNTVFDFDASRSFDTDGKIAEINWDFGDSTTATGLTVTHRYNAVGTYHVTLTVSDHHNATGIATKDVDVLDGVAPTAKFKVSPSSGDEDTLYTFDGSDTISDNKIIDYSWTFGDGKRDNGKIVQHTFHKGGTFDVRLVVTDSRGLVDQVDKDVFVKNFDVAGAQAEIRNLLLRFFQRYSDLEELDSDFIVEGWSPNCSGREHEISIIDGQRNIFLRNDADVIGNIDVTINSNHQKATAPVTAHFTWTTLDNVDHESTCTHFFDLVFESGQWQVCNFTVSCDSAAAQTLFAVGPHP